MIGRWLGAYSVSSSLVSVGGGEFGLIWFIERDDVDGRAVFRVGLMYSSSNLNASHSII